MHQSCYGVLEIPEDAWLCRPCAAGVRTPPAPGKTANIGHCSSSQPGTGTGGTCGGSGTGIAGGTAGTDAASGGTDPEQEALIEPPCVLCTTMGGAMKPVSDSKYKHAWAHVACAICLPECSFDDSLRMEGINGVTRCFVSGSFTFIFIPFTPHSLAQFFSGDLDPQKIGLGVSAHVCAGWGEGIPDLSYTGKVFKNMRENRKNVVLNLGWKPEISLILALSKFLMLSFFIGCVEPPLQETFSNFSFLCPAHWSIFSLLPSSVHHLKYSYYSNQ